MNNMSKQQQQYLLIGGVVVAAVVIFGIALILGGEQGTEISDTEYGDVPTTITEDGAYVLGNPDAPITFVEFADFLCGHCQDYKSVVDQFIEELVLTGQAKFEFRSFPVIQPEGESKFYAQYLECAGELGAPEAFWVAHEELFFHASRGVRSGDAARELATAIDVSYAELLECANEAEQFRVDQQLGQRVGVGGTPAVRVRYNDGDLEIIPGTEGGGIPFTMLESLVVNANS